MVMAYKGSLPTMDTWRNSRATNIYLPAFKWLMTTRLDKVMAYALGHHAQSRMIFWLRDYM